MVRRRRSSARVAAGAVILCGRRLARDGDSAVVTAARPRVTISTDGDAQRGDEGGEQRFHVMAVVASPRPREIGSNAERIAYSANRMSFVEELTWRGLV